MTFSPDLSYFNLLYIKLFIDIISLPLNEALPCSTLHRVSWRECMLTIQPRLGLASSIEAHFSKVRNRKSLLKCQVTLVVVTVLIFLEFLNRSHLIPLFINMFQKQVEILEGFFNDKKCYCQGLRSSVLPNSFYPFLHKYR